VDLGEIHLAVGKILERADRMLVEGFYGEMAIDFKASERHSYAVVTEMDRRLDRMLQEELLRVMPEAGWISEENEDNRAGIWRWIVDPIDGTLNFSKKIPLFGISIGLWEGNQPRYGIVSFPMQRDRVHAIHQQGAYLNGKRIEIMNRVATVDSYWLCDYDAEEGQQQLPNLVRRMGTVPRRMDCATYDMALVALGRAQGALLGEVAIWDIAATLLIAQEAGCKMRLLSPWPHLEGPSARAYSHRLAVGDAAFIASIDALF
jgi:myo-inositol-1(or 4)-monophosphatase